MVLNVFLRLIFVLSVAHVGALHLQAAAYKGAIVVDVATGKTLFEANADLVTPPASVTKLMTFLLVHEEVAAGKLQLTDPVTITAEAAGMGGSQVYLAENEVFTVEELLYALMISSANDAATALAIKVSGSRPAFVERMNARAREIGMTNTTFRTPHGLPPANRRIEDGDLTTPRDLARLSAHLLGKTEVLRYASVENRVFRPGPKQIDMNNHNNLLGKVAGVDGLKTGFTRGAGFCLAATALRNGRRVIAVTMGSPQSQVRDLEIADLFEKAFANLPAMPMILPDGPESKPTGAPAATPAAAAAGPTQVAPAPAAAATPAPIVTPTTQDTPPAVRFVMPGRKS